MLLCSSFFIKIEEMARRSFLGEFELIVLWAVLRLGEEAYGVPIAQELEACSGREVVLGSVYAALERLEQKGLVTSQIGESTPERGGRAKRYFRVTAKGVREARATRHTFLKLWQGVPELQGGQA